MELINQVLMPWASYGVPVIGVASIAHAWFKSRAGWKKGISVAATVCGVAAFSYLNYALLDYFVTFMTTGLQQMPEMLKLMHVLSGPALPEAVQQYLPASHWGEYLDTSLMATSIGAARGQWAGFTKTESLVNYADGRLGAVTTVQDCVPMKVASAPARSGIVANWFSSFADSGARQMPFKKPSVPNVRYD